LCDAFRFCAALEPGTGVLGELEYEDGELADASEDCRGLRWLYSMADDGPDGMAIEEDIGDDVLAMMYLGRGGGTS
jgi:hypothetical protein